MPSIICNDVNVQLNHLADIPLWKKEKPFELNLTGLNSQEPRTNCEYTQHQVCIRDLRTLSLEPSIDTTGFKFIKHVSTCLPSFDTLSNEGDSSTIVPYLEETVDLVKNEFHAEKAFAIDWRYRKNPDVTTNSKGNKNLHRHVPQKPFQTVHSDYSIESGMARVQSFFTQEESEEYKPSHWHIRIVNIWRPFIPVIDDAPLAFCDRRSVNRSDFVPYDKILADRDAENAFLLYRERHRWYWLSKQAIDEPSMFVVWDSLDLEKGPDEVPGLVPHCAFVNPNAGANAPPRRSIEIQVVAVTKR